MIILEDLAAILAGLPSTVALTALSFLIGLVLGVPLCAMRFSKLNLVRFTSMALILTFRAIPPIVWLFFIFFGVGFGYVQLDPFTSAAIGLGLITAANMAEIYRGALAAIHVGQWEASLALNLPLRHELIDVIGPQVVRIAFPSATTYAIGLLKDTAVASAIGVQDISFQAYHLSQQTFRGLDVYAAAGLVYIIVSLPIAWLARRADQRLKAHVAP
ncbi:Amino acid ABC transporter permease [Rhodovastum atsumiense]|uniref:Amino acid ABC transporter permease n=1 Tax=Rhodovastum atsumiense TaxID=504468 RepID=A0A5M6J0T8_9PROT|nr:amino acid ABC transporter permease [Rhodovastum atsumiense]KAA5614121.1 amino acid ABC transporter permease [Rhodovastum atsumiense]CAH2598967.1 Amino acid ABC transporter permease [Rhodovastum atsumiense]